MTLHGALRRGAHSMPDEVGQEVIQSAEPSLAIGGNDGSQLLSYQSAIALCMLLLV